MHVFRAAPTCVRVIYADATLSKENRVVRSLVEVTASVHLGDEPARGQNVRDSVAERVPRLVRGTQGEWSGHRMLGNGVVLRMVCREWRFAAGMRGVEESAW